MQKYFSKGSLFENTIELSFFAIILLSVLTQKIFGNSNIIPLILRNISVSGTMFLAGYYTSEKAQNSMLLFKKGLFYVLFFLLFGCIDLVLKNNKPLFFSLTRLITLLKIPEQADLFFTISVIFFFAAIFCDKVHDMKFKKIPVILLSLFVFTVFLIPTQTFDYAIIGVFLGTDDYNCIPVLPFLLFYFCGIYVAKTKPAFKVKHFLFAGIITVLSVLLYRTPLKDICRVTIGTFPVYMIYTVATNVAWYQKLLNIPFELLDLFTQKLYRAFFDSNGKIKKTIPVYLTIYTFCFCTLSVVVFSPFWIVDSSLIWNHDTLSQYIPKSYYYMDYMQTLFQRFLNGNFNIPTYDFQIGLGGPITFNTEPIFLLLALFPAEKVEAAYTFISMLRLYLAGLSASALLLYFKKEHYEALFGSLVYIFSGFALYAVVIHGQFISPMILFPLLIISTEEIFQKKRWYLCTIVVAVSLLSNYYFAYMNTLAIGLYFLFRFIFTKDKEKKTFKYFLSATALFSGAYLLGVLIGNLSLFTSFSSFLGSGRTGGVAASTPSLFSYGKRLPTKLLISFFSPPGNTGYSSKYGFVPLAFLAVIIFYMKKGNRMLKYLFALYTAFCIFPFAGLVFSGFSVVINRWGFMYALLVAFITACMLSKLRTLSRRELGILFIGMLPLVAIIIFDSEYPVASAPVGMIMLLISYILILFTNENLQIISPKYFKPAMLLLCIVSIIVNSHLQYTIGDTEVHENFIPQGEVLKEITSTPLCAAESIDDDSFYRVATTEIETKNINSSLIMDFSGINIFASTVDGSFVDFNHAMANSTWTMILYKGFDNRTFLNTLANVKYFTTTDEFEEYIPYGYIHLKDKTINDNNYSIYENQYALPFGYTYSKTVTEEELVSLPAIKQQEILLNAASVAKADSSLNVSAASLPSTAKEIELLGFEGSKGIEFKDNKILITKENASITLYFESLPDSETYIEYTGYCIPEDGERSGTIDFNIVQNENESYFYQLRGRENTYTTNQDVYLYNLGYHKDAINSCTITFETLGELKCDSFRLYAQPMDSYPAQIELLKKDVMENVVISSSKVSGKIHLEEDKFLVTAIPYQNGWTAYVDGEKTDIQKANYMFSGLYLDAGEHTIEFKYQLPGIRLSFIVSGVGIIIFIIALIVRHRRIKQ